MRCASKFILGNDSMDIIYNCKTCKRKKISCDSFLNKITFQKLPLREQNFKIKFFEMYKYLKETTSLGKLQVCKKITSLRLFIDSNLA